MDSIDSAILTSCAEDFRPLKPLFETIPKGTAYRHAKRLLQLGWLVREGGLYQATDAGRRQLQAAQRGQQWNRLDVVYPPIQYLPTDVHRAVFELALAAVICRQYETRSDRHPFFVCAGKTLRWKSSLGMFLCHALGLDPGRHIVECASEAGKSLFVRRDAGGTVVYKRKLLDTPVVILDEFQTAAPPVRAALIPLLSGRLVVPIENAQLTVRCVPLVLLNPGTSRPGSSALVCPRRSFGGASSPIWMRWLCRTWRLRARPRSSPRERRGPSHFPPLRKIVRCSIGELSSYSERS